MSVVRVFRHYNGISLQWLDEIRYLGVYIVRSSRFKISLANSKRSFYRVANSIFGKVGRVASEEVTIQLFISKCLPVYCFLVLKPARSISQIFPRLILHSIDFS